MGRSNETIDQDLPILKELGITAKPSIEEFANSFFVEVQVIADEIKAIKEELYKCSSDYLRSLESLLEKNKAKYSFFKEYAKDKVKEIEELEIEIRRLEAEIESVREKVREEEFYERSKVYLQNLRLSLISAKAKRYRFEEEHQSDDDGDEDDDDDELEAEIKGIEAEIEIEEEKKAENGEPTVSDHVIFISQKSETLKKLKQTFDNLIFIAPLLVRTIVQFTSENEINNEKEKLIAEYEDIIRTLTAKKTEEDIQAQIILAKQEIEKLRTINIADLRDELAEKAQKAFYKKAFWYRLKKLNSEECITERMDYFIEEAESDYAYERATFLELYQRVITHGVNPKNALFASIAYNSEKTELILPLADKWQELITKRRGMGLGEKTKVNLIKKDNGKLNAGFFNIITDSPTVDGEESFEGFVNLQEELQKKVGTIKTDNTESNNINELDRLLRETIEEIKRVCGTEIEGNLENIFPNPINSHFYTKYDIEEAARNYFLEQKVMEIVVKVQSELGESGPTLQ